MEIQSNTSHGVSSSSGPSSKFWLSYKIVDPSKGSVYKIWKFLFPTDFKLHKSLIALEILVLKATIVTEQYYHF